MRTGVRLCLDPVYAIPPDSRIPIARNQSVDLADGLLSPRLDPDMWPDANCPKLRFYRSVRAQSFFRNLPRWPPATDLTDALLALIPRRWQQLQHRSSRRDLLESADEPFSE